MDRQSDQFVQLLTAHQSSLYAAIYALLPDRTAARDVLQETNLTLWHKADDFEAGTHFMAWAGRIAHYHVLNARRKMRRDRLVFDDELFESLVELQAERLEGDDQRERALLKCLGNLPKGQRHLIERRYASGGSVQKIAEEDGKSVGAISQTLYRIREALLNCMHQSSIQEVQS